MAKLEVHLDDHVINLLKDGKLPTLQVKEGNLKYLSKSSLKLLINCCPPTVHGNSDVTTNGDNNVADDIPGLNSVSDLEPSKYEGGFKVWESTKDLLQLLYQEPNLVHGKRVLDIGCGSGLIGITALKLGASHVSFQDFNLEVLKWFTLPNIVLNLVDGDTGNDINTLINDIQSKVSLFSGDWSETPIKEDDFDVVITSETIYNQDNYLKLSNLLEKCTKKDGGKVIVGAKTYYFGVGGGTRSFEEFISKETSFKNNYVIKVIDSPVQREIIGFER